MNHFIISIFFFFLSSISLFSQQNSELPTSDKGTCFPVHIEQTGEMNRIIDVTYDSVTAEPKAMLISYGDGSSFMKIFDTSTKGRYSISESLDMKDYRKTDFISLGGKGLWKTTYAADSVNLEKSEKKYIHFGEISFKKDTIKMSSVYHDRVNGGDTLHSETVVRMNKDFDHISREIYINGELSKVIFYEGYENRFNPISYIEGLSLNYLPNRLYSSATEINYIEGKPEKKYKYNYEFEYNDDLLPTVIIHKIGERVINKWKIDYSCVE